MWQIFHMWNVRHTIYTVKQFWKITWRFTAVKNHSFAHNAKKDSRRKPIWKSINRVIPVRRDFRVLNVSWRLHRNAHWTDIDYESILLNQIRRSHITRGIRRCRQIFLGMTTRRNHHPMNVPDDVLDSTNMEESEASSRHPALAPRSHPAVGSQSEDSSGPSSTEASSRHPPLAPRSHPAVGPQSEEPSGPSSTIEGSLGRVNTRPRMTYGCGVCNRSFLTKEETIECFNGHHWSIAIHSYNAHGIRRSLDRGLKRGRGDDPARFRLGWQNRPGDKQ